MMLFIFLCSISILPLVHNENLALPTEKVKSIVPPNPASSTTKDFSLHSEGGTLVASSPDLSLTKDKEVDQNEKLGTQDTPIKARKGVDDIPGNHTVTTKSSLSAPDTGHAKNESHLLITKIIANGNAKNLSSTNSKPIVETKVPKKPQILSYEALVSADKNIHNEIKTTPVNPSSSLLNAEKNQIPSPNEGAVVKLYPSKANSHPGMIMPIVITILVVPMFAIFGYMALKRGQEAWKNRHYKRMDFLLDGMYND